MAERAPVRIGIIGAGGIGGYYGGLLARAGNDVRVLARGENLEAIRANGLIARTPTETWTSNVHASDDAGELAGDFGEGDFAMIATKAYSLNEIAPAAKVFAGRGATIVPLNNGVEAADILISLGIPRERLLGGVTYISAVRSAPGVGERRTPLQRVIIGELGGGLSRRAADIAAAFVDAGAEGEATSNVTLAVWQKFVFLSSMAAACGLTRLNIGSVRQKPLGVQLLDRAVNEAVAVGRARGVALRSDEEAQVMARINELPGEVEPSLLLDLRSGSRTEVDFLSGAISRFGDAAGIDTPIHDTAALALVQAHATKELA